MLTLDDPIEELPYAGRFLPKLKRLEISTIRGLLFHLPFRHEDYSKIKKVEELEEDEVVTIQGIIQNASMIRSRYKRMYITEALIADETGSIQAIWFNQPYLRKQLIKGKRISCSGKVSKKGNKLSLSSPMFEILSDPEDTTHTGRIVPIYPATKGITSKGIRFLLKNALQKIKKIQDPIPHNIRSREHLLDINEALHTIHFPETLEEAENARHRFDFEDLFLLQLYQLDQKLKLKETKAPAIPIEIDEIKALLKTLPFTLTGSQKKSLWETIKDMMQPTPMNRLLQGDVGSGKTIVVAVTAILAAHKGHQTTLMAPTEILARQHYKNLLKFFPDFEEGICLLTSAEIRTSYGKELEHETKRANTKKEIAEGKIKIIVGTHALIQKDIEFSNLALVIIDEQHRFGVRQRAELVQGKKTIPHFLSMSATPIPRTLSLTLFGDLDLSLITELPKNRKPIDTRVVDPKDRTKAYQFIRDEIKKGRQAFVVCPRIEPEELTNPSHADFLKLEVKSVKKEYEKLSETIFPDLTVAMLHGKLKPKEKESTMKKFTENETKILVATSVVEVGIDVPNATIMMIEGSELFGLAQLYQFRGRVGRGEHQSYCFLFTEAHSESTHNRLRSIAQARNGLELAERDLKLRGPGELLGEEQTGMPDLAMKALKNPTLVKSARDAAQDLLTQDRRLQNHPLLQKRLTRFQRDVHWE